MNPMQAFLSEYGPAEKTAGFTSSVAKHLPEQLALGAATAGAAGLVAGAGVGANAIYNAVTKGRDFRSMLGFNEDLKAMHRENPKYVNAAFSTLRRMNTSFSKDPMVAGAFVRQMVTTPEAAFGLAGQAAGFAPKDMGAVGQAAMQGLGAGVAPQATLGRQADLKRMEAIFRSQGQSYPIGKVTGDRPGDVKHKAGLELQDSPGDVLARIRSMSGK